LENTTNEKPKVAFVKQVLDIFGPWSSVKWNDTDAEGLFKYWPNKASIWEMTCQLQADWYVVPQKCNFEYTNDAVLKYPGREKVIIENTKSVVLSDQIPYHNYDIVIAFDPVIDVPTSSDTLFAYCMNEHWEKLYAQSLKSPINGFDLFLAHMMDGVSACTKLPQSVSFPLMRDPQTTRKVFNVPKKEKAWADWRMLTYLAGTSKWDSRAEQAAKSLQEGLNLSIRFKSFVETAYNFSDPPAWGDAAVYLEEMAACKYYFSIGRPGGAGQGICDAASVGCICFGETNKPNHRIICHPKCLCEDPSEFYRQFVEVQNSTTLQQEILNWQDKMLITHFVDQPLAILNDALKLKRNQVQKASNVNGEQMVGKDSRVPTTVNLKTPKKNADLTLFAFLKDLSGPAAQAQEIAICSWMQLNPRPEIILLGEADGLDKIADKFHLKHIPAIKVNQYGTPLVNDLFEKAQASASCDFMAYVNSDIILLDDFIPAIEKCKTTFDEFLMIGARWDADLPADIDIASDGWQDTLRQYVHQHAYLHAVSGIDYFVFTRYLWPLIPDFGIGRTAWDNWLVGKPLESGKAVIDATQTVTAIHQDHRYVPFNGRLQEEVHNSSLAGQKVEIGNIASASFKLTPFGLAKRHIGEFFQIPSLVLALRCVDISMKHHPEIVKDQYRRFAKTLRPDFLAKIRVIGETMNKAGIAPDACRLILEEPLCWPEAVHREMLKITSQLESKTNRGAPQTNMVSKVA
jgi:hypothetical protein